MATQRIHAKGPFVYEEYNAGGAITPGHLIKLTENNTVVVHDVPEGECEKMFAQEDALQGKTIDDAYAADDLVGCIILQLGACVYGWLAAGEECAIGDHLVSNGDGTLKSLALGSATVATNVVAVALEALDSAASAQRILVRAAPQ